jgi:site-specific DNA-methyltransferase (adenine-specific)
VIELTNKLIQNKWENILPLLPDESIDLVLSDPPYGISFHGRKKAKNALTPQFFQNDSDLEWLDKWVLEIHRVLKPDRHAYIFCSWHNVDRFKRALEAHFKIKNILVWHKNHWGGETSTVVTRLSTN